MNFKITSPNQHVFTLLFLLLANLAFAQEGYYRYWVELKDKDSTFNIQQPQEFLSQKSIDRRTKYHIAISETDLPVNKKYIKIIKEKGFRVIHSSKWLNAITIQSTKKNLIDSLSHLPFVSKIKYLGFLKFNDDENTPDEPISINEALSVLESKFDNKKSDYKDTNFYGKSYSQMNMLNIPKLHQMGFMGEGITIAIFDAGFKSANKIGVFKFAFDSSLVKGTKDFIERNNNVFDDDDHGIGVWSCMAAYKPYQLVGTSPKSNFWLLRTEYSSTESPIEETHWLAAAEFADSVGVDIINSSLGYSKFDDATLSYQYKDLDGKTTLISRAASMAAKKGILVLNSAGNDGGNDLNYLSAPADAFNVLSVGGVDEKRIYSSFSSVGPTADKRIKPDVAALGENVFIPSASNTFYQSNGTSYACPIVTGLVSCLLQSNPTKTNTEIFNAIRLSSSQYYAPDKFLGYGIPDAYLANKILGGDKEYALKKDLILDASVLADNKVHLTLFLHTSQKVTIVIEDTRNLQSPPVFSGTIECKNIGVNRITLEHLKKLPNGIFAVYIHAKDGVSSYLLKN
jgi:hypothetical protein